MKAGRELDALVAEKVMGWRIHEGKHGGRDWGCPPYNPEQFGAISLYLPEAIPHYSTSIAAAWEVVEWFIRHPANPPVLEGLDMQLDFSCDGWTFTIYTFGGPDHEMDGVAGESADTAPLAICLAALRAVGYEVPA